MLLGIDVGEKRVGVALSNESETIASPLAAFNRAKAGAEKDIIALIAKHGIKIVVVGLPLSADGRRTEQCGDVENFCRRLLKRSEVEVRYVDEYLTSEDAKERLGIRGSASKKQREKGLVDAMSASIILQNFIDERAKGAD